MLLLSNMTNKRAAGTGRIECTNNKGHMNVTNNDKNKNCRLGMPFGVFPLMTRVRGSRVHAMLMLMLLMPV